MADRRRKETFPAAASGRYAYEGLDRVLHEKARLSILVSLGTRADGLVFGELRELCGLTDGNLNRHLEVLRQAGLVELWKGYAGRRPQTLARLTPEGRKRFLAYLAELNRVLEDARSLRKKRSAQEDGARKKPPRADPGFTFNPV